MVCFHDGVTDRSDTFEEVLRIFFAWAWKWLDEDYLRGGLWTLRVEPLDTDGHGDGCGPLQEEKNVGRGSL